MQINLGKTDKYFRMLIGLLIIVGGVAFQSWWGLAGAVLVLTALLNWCPIYALFGMNTCNYK
jgi:hypothetical protein